MDNNCAFGKRLHERIEVFAKDPPYYNAVVKLHAQFHTEAGTILELAPNGDKDQISKLMAIGENFEKDSGH